MEFAEKYNLSYEFASKKLLFTFPDLGMKHKPSYIRLHTGESAEQIQGFSVAQVLVDEAASCKWSDTNPTEDAILQAMSRMDNEKANFRQMLLCGSPENTLENRFFKFFETPNPNKHLYKMSARENPHVKEWVEDMLSEWSPELVKAYIDGDWINMSSARCYTSFSEKNIDANIDLDPRLPLHISFDFGANVGVVLLVGQEQKGTLVTTHEIHREKLTTAGAMNILKEILSKYPPFDEIQIYGDAMGQYRGGSSSTETDYTVIRQHILDWKLRSRLRILSKNPQHTERVNRMNVALQNIYGEIGLKIHPRCAKLKRDFENVTWDESGTRIAKSLSVSHWSDAEGYRVFYLRNPKIRKENPIRGRVSVS